MTRKRSKYRPRGVIMDTMAHVSVGLKPLAEIDDALVILRIRNHDALASIAQGKGTRGDIDTVVAALNMAEALTLQNVGEAYRAQIRESQDALKTMAARGVANSDKFICNGPELTAINWGMEIHDAQLEAVNVKQLETAIKKVANIVKSGGARKI